MKKELITIIIPVYNVEKYLNKCIKSIINQTYTNLEINLIDDGSIDNSGKICDEFSKKDKRINVFHINNHGVSYARNYGLRYSNGKYLIFIDSDDWLEKNMIEVLYKNLVLYNSDVIACDYYFNYENNEIKHNARQNIEVIDDKHKMLTYLFDDSFYGGYLWNKLIKKDILKNSKLKFDENVKICEDLLFLSKVINKIKRIVYIPNEALYHYRKRPDSAVNFNYTLKDITKLIPLKYFLDNNYNCYYKNLNYQYFILNCQSIYILKKEKINDKKSLKKLKFERKKYLKKALLEGNFKQNIKVLLWMCFPIICGKILNRKNMVKK